MALYIAILLVMTLLGSFAGLLFKKTSDGKEKNLLKNKYLYLGGILYFIASLLNIFVLSKLEYSYVLPFTALTYVWTMFISYLVLKEKITAKKIIGVTLIVGGAIMISLG